MGDERPSTTEPHTPRMSEAEVAMIEAWHERAYQELRDRTKTHVDYLGLELAVPPEVFPPTPMSDLFGRLVLDEVRPDDRVLDMGTGSGSNALLAARVARDVTAVDINPAAVVCAEANAAANGLDERVTVMVSDVFDRVDGTFDVIMFDPPFRWFPPRTPLEAAITDDGYRTLNQFMAELPERLRPGGRALLTFGTTGDLTHLLHLFDTSGLECETLDRRDLERDGRTASYFTYRLTRH